MPTSLSTPSHLLALEGMSRESITTVLDSAAALRSSLGPGITPSPRHAGRVIANCFFESSTRTRLSFAMAAERIGARVLDFASGGSSVTKGESLTDTALTIEAMGIDAMVVRAQPSGAAKLIAEHVRCPVINAGDGCHEHPTQGLLDALTMRDHLGDLSGRHVAIVGDINASRVARSNVHCLTTLGADVTLVGPAELVDPEFTSIAAGPGKVRIAHDFDQVIANVDAVMMLRVQFERGSNIGDDYRERYRLTPQRADRLRSIAIVLHPGPLNRDIEIDCNVADGDRSVILEQVRNGVAVRMAVLDRALGATRSS